MLPNLGATQQKLLKFLLRCKNGKTIDELIPVLSVTRTAVAQHLQSLEESGYIIRGNPQVTGGRPVQIYKLSPSGMELFPKQYSWFSEVMIEAVKKDRGSEGLSQWMSELGTIVARSLEPRLKGLDFKARVQEISKVMNELAYEAQVNMSADDETIAIEAVNCVYHNMALRFSEVCAFDRALLKGLSGAEVNHEKCIVRGDNACCFKLEKS